MSETAKVNSNAKVVFGAKIVGVLYLLLVIAYSYARFSSAETAQKLATLDWAYIFTVVNCLLLFAGLYFGLKKPIMAMLEQAIQKSIKNLNEARQAKAEAEHLKVRRQEMIVAIDREKQELATYFVTEKATDAQNILDQARKEAQNILDNTKLSLATEMKSLTNDLRKKIVKETLSQVEQMIDGKVTDTDHHKMFNDFIEQLNTGEKK